MDRGFALVTGASKGLGVAFAEQLAVQGWNLALAARSKPELEALAARLQAAHSIRCAVLPADLSKASAPADLEGQLKAQGLAVELLINNAGFGLLGRFADADLGRLMEMIHLNVGALTELTRRLLPPMIAQKRGFVLNVASTAGFVPGPFMAVYYASKAYVLSLSEALHAELAGTGVVVSCLCPGATRTQFAETAGSSQSKLFKGANVMEAGPVVRAGLEGLFAGRALVIPGLTNKLMIQSLRLAPRAMTRTVAKRYQQLD
jgi:uncharacterized protein